MSNIQASVITIVKFRRNDILYIYFFKKLNNFIFNKNFIFKIIFLKIVLHVNLVQYCSSI